MKQEYDVVSSDDLHDFVQSVDKMLSAGWVCQGGVFVTKTVEPVNLSNETVTVFYQAVVREAKKGKPSGAFGF